MTNITLTINGQPFEIEIPDGCTVEASAGKLRIDYAITNYTISSQTCDAAHFYQWSKQHPAVIASLMQNALANRTEPSLIDQIEYHANN